MHFPFYYVFDYLVFLECGQCFPEIEWIYMHEYILKRHLTLHKMGLEFLKILFIIVD